MATVLKKKIKSVLKRKFNRTFELQYLKDLRKPIRNNAILIESTQGRDFSGHVFYITKEIEKQYPNMTIYVVVKADKIESVKQMFVRHGMGNSIKIIEFLSKEYILNLATSKYLINDTTFWDFFSKRPEQKYINIWHGTPLKCLGKHMKPDGFGNVQKNFLSTDLFVLSNEYTKKKMVDGYNLKDISSTKVVVGPSPRNSILFDQEIRKQIRKELGVVDKQVILYMPTYRDNGTSINTIEETLEFIDARLPDNYVMYVKLHPFDAEKLNLDLSRTKKIKEFPNYLETYEFLTAVDTLVTDYSSIMYDFANTNRNVLLYTYDKADYYNARGLYEDIDKYPFTQVKTKQDLLENLLKPKNIHPEKLAAFKSKFVPNDCIEGAKQIVDYLFEQNKSAKISEYELRNKKDNIIFFAGKLWDNGISRAFFNTIDSIDLSEKNYILYIADKSVKKEHLYKLQQMKIPYILSSGVIQFGLIEGLLTYFYLNTEWFGRTIGKKLIESKIFKMYRRDFLRMFNGLEVNQFIHYTGFERSLATMLAALSTTKTRTTIFYHTDMFEEYEAKKNVNMKTLKRAYESADQLVVVNKELKTRLLENYPALNNIVVLDNFLGYQDIRKQSQESIFTSLLSVPLQYAYSEEIFTSCSKVFSEIEKSDIKTANKLLPIIKKHQLGTENHFPYLMAKLPEFNEIINSPFKKIANTVAEITIDENELSYIYGASKMKLIDNLLDPNIQVFVNIGRFDYQKSHDRLIDGFKAVNKVYPNTRLVIIAPHGPLKNDTIKRIRQSGIKEKIIILGGMDNPYSLLRLADAFVFTSRYEGLGLVVFEALAVGTDVITVDIPATTEGIIRGSSKDHPSALIVENSLAGIINGWMEYMKQKPQFGTYDFESQEALSLDVWDEIVG